MAVTNTTATAGPYAGNGSTTAFPFAFAAKQASEVGVFVDGVQATSGFTVALDTTDYQGGTVTFLTAPAAGQVVELRSEPTMQQTTTLVDADAQQLRKAVQEALDLAAIRDIFLQDAISRIPKGDKGDKGDTGATGASGITNAPAYLSENAPAASARRLVFLADYGQFAISDGTNYQLLSTTSLTPLGSFDPASLFASGENGAIYSTTSGLYQDAKGLTPVTAAGDPVGMWVPTVGATTGPDLLLSAGAASIGAGWAYNSGTRTGTATASSGVLRIPHTNADNVRYVLNVTVTVTSGSLAINIGANASFGTTVTTSGTYTFHFNSGGAVDAGTYFTGTAFTGTVVYNYVKLESPWTLFQATAGNRPAYRIDARGKGYVEITATKTLSTPQTLTLAMPVYMAGAVSRDTAAAEAGPTFQAAGASAGITNTTDTTRISIGSARSGIFAQPGTRVGAAPLGVPVPFDLLVAAGQTSVYIGGGQRDVPDSVGLAAGELRTEANTFTGGDSYATSFFVLQGMNFYGGLIRMAATSALDRTKVGKWARKLVAHDALYANNYVIFAIAGQSNAMGVGNSATSTAVPFGNAAEYIDSGYLKPLVDPTQHSNPGQTSLTGSMWPAFGKRYFELTGRRACISGSAWSGEGLKNGAIGDNGGWLGNTPLIGNLASKLATARADLPGSTVGGVLYMGGENDVTLSFTVAQYKSYLVQFRDALRTATGIADLKLLIISLDNNAANSAKYALIRQAQSEAAAENEGIDLVASYQDYVVGQGLSADGIHLNQTALNDYGAKVAAGVAALGI